MKKIIKLFTMFLFTSGLVIAQSSNYSLNMKMVITSPDTQKITLNHIGEMDEAIEGYYRISRYDDPFYGKNASLQPGGFSFLDSEVFGGYAEIMSKKWIQNKFPVEDIETMTNGMDIQKVLSFQIKPVVIDADSDTLNLLIKYAVYDFIKQKDYDLNFDYNVRLFYKLVHIQYEEEITLNFINEQFKNHNITFQFTKEKMGGKYLTIKNEASLFTEIQKSASESMLTNSEFNIDIELTQYNESAVNLIAPKAKYQEQNLPSVKIIADNTTNEKAELPIKIYYGKLNFPFILYNTQKEKLYKNYKSKENVFQSTYNIIIVPIDLVGDSLTFDFFINYSKLNLNDNIPRWTPIKKRLTIGNEGGTISITLPKENWSANFTRSGEHYDIYGYPDFERFVKEQLHVKYEVLNNRGK